MNDALDAQRRQRRHDRQKVRDEFRDDLRKTLIGRLDIGAIRTEAQALVKEAVDKRLETYLKCDTTPQFLIRQIVREELEKELGNELGMRKDAKPLADLVKQTIREEFQQYARAFIQKNLSVQIIDGAQSYGDAGSF